MSKQDILNLDGTTNWDSIANLLDDHETSIDNLDKKTTYVTPEEFGAVGDGVTDDTLAFTNALKQHGNVKCTTGKVYYFAGIVDVSSLSTGILDLNRCFLKNFHIKINLKDNGYQARTEWPVGWFKICNGSIGGDWATAPKDWQIPVIQTGTGVCLQDLIFYCCPYVVALTNNYRDLMRFDNILNCSGNVFPADSLTLDGICGIIGDGQFANRDSTVYKNTPNASGQGTAGDGWIFMNCNEWHFTNNTNYSFVTLVSNQSATAINCIQSRFIIGTGTKATFIDCHWEEKSSFPIVTTGGYFNSLVFMNCFFYGAYALETHISAVTYMNCFFRVGSSQTSDMKNTPFATNLGNLDIYHVKCKIISCLFDDSYIYNSDDLKSWKYLPKHTATFLNSSYVTKLSDTPTTGTLSSGSYRFPEIGDYKYDIYLFASNCGTATEYVQITRTVVSADSACFSSTYWGHSGGWGFVIFRTLPSGVIQKGEFWFNPASEYQNSQYNLPIRFYEYGQWLEFQIVDTEQYIAPWITVTSIPAITVNANLFEKNGVLITTDNTSIGLNNYNSYAQVNNVYIGSPTVSTITSTTVTIAVNSINLFDTTSNSIVATLPTAVGRNAPIIIKLKAITAGNTLTLKANGTQTIDGQTSMVINTVNTSLTLYSDGSNWYIV